MSSGPAQTIAGIFLIMFGVGLTFVGGGCGWFFLKAGGSDAAIFLLISLMTLLGGLAAIVQGLRMMA